VSELDQTWASGSPNPDSTHAQLSAQTFLSSRPMVFSRAIIQSGPLAARHIWTKKRYDRVWGRVLASFGVDSDSPAERVQAMRNIPPQELHRLTGGPAQVGTWGVHADGVFVPVSTYHADQTFKKGDPRADFVTIGDCADEVSSGLLSFADRISAACSLSVSPSARWHL
jgi:carboxylesterase type B